MDRIKHLENKYSIARYDLIRECDGDEMRFYLYLKLYAINKHEAFPTYTTISKDLGWDRKKISRLIKLMVKKGRLKIGKLERRIKGVKQVVNVYDITWYDHLNNQGRSRGKNEGGSGKMELPFERRGSGKMELKQVDSFKQLTPKGGNGVALLRTYFTDQCKQLKGFEPEMAFGKEGKLLKEKIKRYSIEQLKDLIDKFLNSRVGEDLGYTLSICLSAGVINQWLIGKLERPKKAYFQGNPMRKIFNKWQVLENGEWLEFAGLEKEIEWK